MAQERNIVDELKWVLCWTFDLKVWLHFNSLVLFAYTVKLVKTFSTLGRERLSRTDYHVSSFKFIQKFKNLAKKRETGPQVARANLGGPDLQLFKDKINIITVTTIKNRTNRI